MRCIGGGNKTMGAILAESVVEAATEVGKRLGEVREDGCIFIAASEDVGMRCNKLSPPFPTPSIQKNLLVWPCLLSVHHVVLHLKQSPLLSNMTLPVALPLALAGPDSECGHWQPAVGTLKLQKKKIDQCA